MKLAVDTYFAPLLRGADATRVPALMAHLDRAIKENRFARSAIETALLDAHGKRTGLPVSELLGGRRRERLPVSWTLSSRADERRVGSACVRAIGTRGSHYHFKITKKVFINQRESCN